MTHEIVWADDAFRAAQTFMVDDLEGLIAVFDTVDALAVDPRPAAAFPWGMTGFFRLRRPRRPEPLSPAVGFPRAIREECDRETASDLEKRGGRYWD